MKSNAKCVKCDLEVRKQDAVTCGRCAKWRHMTKKCAGFSKATFDKDVSLKNSFRCKECVSSSESEDESDEAETKDSALMAVLSRITRLEKRIDKKLDNVNRIADMFSAQIDDVAKLKASVADLQQKVKRLERAPKQMEEQHKEVIVTNIPPLEKEDVNSVAFAVFKGLEAKIDKEDVTAVSRFETTVDEKKRYFLRVKMASYEAKGKVIKAARAAKTTLKDLNLQKALGASFSVDPTRSEEILTAPIFVNEAVSKATRTLLLAAIKLKKEKKIHTTWTYLNKVYVRKEQKSTPILVNSEEALQALVEA